MSEQRTAYTISAGTPPKVVTVTAVITPKRIAVYTGEWPWRGGMFFEPTNFPNAQYAWTEREAWVKFLHNQRADLKMLVDSVNYAAQQIADAQTVLADRGVPDAVRSAVLRALRDGYEEGAIEAVLLAMSLTRDEAVDVVEHIAETYADVIMVQP